MDFFYISFHLLLFSVYSNKYSIIHSHQRLVIQCVRALELVQCKQHYEKGSARESKQVNKHKKCMASAQALQQYIICW